MRAAPNVTVSALRYGGMSCSVVHMTKPASPKYTIGQRVEVLTVDFEALHLPYVWTPGTVTVADPMDGGRWRVVVTCDNGNLLRQVVGKRDGNKRMRAL